MNKPQMESAGHDLYVRQRDTNGKATARWHRVWNTGVALEALNADCRKLNDKAREEKRPAKASIEVIDEKTYRREYAP